MHINFDYIINSFENNIKNVAVESARYVELEDLGITIDYIKEFYYNEISNDGFTEQGITIAENNVLISAYTNVEGYNSRIYIYNKLTGDYKGYISLDINTHVGGITYDSKNKILYVAGSKGRIFAYDYSLIKAYMKNNIQNDLEISLDTLTNINYKIDNKIQMPEDKSSSTTYFYDGKLYIASFEGLDNGIIQINDISVEQNDNKKILNNRVINEFMADSQMQGIAIFDYKNNKYLLTSQSLGFIDSTINVYKMNEIGNINYLGSYYTRRGLEGIYFLDSGYLIGSFEIGKQKIDIIKFEDMLNSLIDKNNNKNTFQNNMAAFSGFIYDYQRKR